MNQAPNKRLMTIYGALLEEHGFQKWWPTTPKGRFVPEYDGGPKNDKQRLEIIFGALLTQNTQWNPNVMTAIEKLNREDLIDIDKIIRISHKRLALLIKSSGYNNQKAERLKIMAKFIKDYGGLKRLFSLDVPDLRETLLSIKGVGPETADSIILYAAEKPSFIIDAYTRRIFSRLGYVLEDAKYDAIRDFFMDNLPHEALLFNEYHALIVEHAKVCCRKAGSKEDCILKKYPAYA